MKKRKPPVELIEFTSDLVDAAGRSDGPLASLSKTDREFAVERYRKFLALAKRHPESRLAPTSDIDQVWHIHMLMPRAYAADCQEYLGEILDHNGGFGRKASEVPEMREIFETTAKLWEKEFGEPYLRDVGTESPLPVCFSAATQAYVYCFRRS